jgi:HSP20 family protein
MSTTQIDTTKSRGQEAETRTWRRPHYDVLENDEAFNVRVTMPGVSHDGVDVSIDGEMLSITGTRATATPKGWHVLRSELPEGDYHLNLRLNVAVDEAKIRAHVEDGILDLTLPKADWVKPRKIKIS